MPAPTATWVATPAPLKALPTPPVMPPTTPLKAAILGSKVPVAMPAPDEMATPIRIPAPIAWPPGTNSRPTPAATVRPRATEPQGSFLIASQAAPRCPSSSACFLWLNSSWVRGRRPEGSTRLTGSFQA